MMFIANGVHKVGRVRDRYTRLSNVYDLNQNEFTSPNPWLDACSLSNFM